MEIVKKRHIIPTKFRRSLRKDVRGFTSKLDEFWNFFEEQYLLSLRERMTKISKNGVPREPAIGEVVLIHENCPRGSWKLGRVLSLKTSVDGKKRNAQLQNKEN
uniref:DUF5641 domain-containing protein n=1 Tax=Ditylenchus dipsaci TaxID=166011 RepID=A0A915D766_9BILA